SCPTLALDDPALGPIRQFEVDVAVRSVLPADLADLPPVAPENLPHEPFKFLGAEEAKIRGPLHEMAPVASLELEPEPTQADERGERSPDEVRIYQVWHRPSERQGQE